MSASYVLPFASLPSLQFRHPYGFNQRAKSTQWVELFRRKSTPTAVRSPSSTMVKRKSPVQAVGYATSNSKESPIHVFLLGMAAAGTATILTLAQPPPSLAYAPPSFRDVEQEVLLPNDGGARDVLDFGNVLSTDAEERLQQQLEELERETSWKLRVVTGYGPGSTPTSASLQKYWNADSKTIIMSADEFKGNILEFYYDSVNPAVKSTITKNVFQELRGRFGNVYFIREEGTEAAVVAATDVLRVCLLEGGCTFVPGLSEQQRLFSLIAVTSGAFLSGAVLRNGLSRWTFIFLFIWVPWIGLFGFYPLYIRQPEDLTPLFQNAGIFATCFSLTWLTPILGVASLPTMGADSTEARKSTDQGVPDNSKEALKAIEESEESQFQADNDK
ncbi:hypothetical protein CYMTET_43004 [Cymbomonas tetramitiformis]|uniref:TPM domain-containing protein n=1 Tax=Cymbomonas tetramitiformis TaxID=36881 RepID=A0AAE0C455_9CHLO|nr:hypothetical protein CYMTET_43004 [Cymbomonas tetramitiformis]